ncbi:lipoprotein [Amphibacillus sp. Q70]|uniref:lipoprotein n=1 Tax=Amphibacillus sp. Q70 TaxID=3453416 RepID=UPI003F85E37F
MKKVLFILLSVLFLAGCGNSRETQESVETDDNDLEVIEDGDKEDVDEVKDDDSSEEEQTEEGEDESNGDEPDQDEEETDSDFDIRKSELERLDKSRVRDEYSETSVTDIRVNDDSGTGEGYIVLVDLSFDRQNTASTSKEMVDMYASDLTAYIGEETDDVNQVVSFWGIPYLQDEGNVVKITTERSGDGMAFIEQWYEPSIFE